MGLLLLVGVVAPGSVLGQGTEYLVVQDEHAATTIQLQLIGQTVTLDQDATVGGVEVEVADVVGEEPFQLEFHRGYPSEETLISVQATPNEDGLLGFVLPGGLSLGAGIEYGFQITHPAGFKSYIALNVYQAGFLITDFGARIDLDLKFRISAFAPDLGGIGDPGGIGGIGENQPPWATDLEVVGLPIVGNTLTAQYAYFDAESDPEQGSQIRWYRSKLGEYIELIDGATSASYTLTGDDLGLVMWFTVTPANEFSTGAQVGSDQVGPVEPAPDAPRLVSIERWEPLDETTSASEVVFRVTFDRSVSGVDISDFSVDGTHSPAGVIESVNSVDGRTYDVRVTALDDSEGSLGLTIAGVGGMGGDSGTSSGGFVSLPILEQAGFSNPFGYHFVVQPGQTELQGLALGTELRDHNLNSPFTLVIYEGSGFGGPVILEQELAAATATGFQWVGTSFATPVALTTGSSYTVSLGQPGIQDNNLRYSIATATYDHGGVCFPNDCRTFDIAVQLDFGPTAPLSSQAPDISETYTLNNYTPPVAVADSFPGDEDLPLSGNVLENDLGAGGGDLSVSLGEILVSYGSLELGADGTFTYIPIPDFFGTDSFSYILSDESGGTSIGTVTLVIDAVDDPPQLSAPEIVVVVEDTKFAFHPDSPYAVALSDIDQGSDVLAVQLLAVRGLVSFSGAASGLTIDWTSPNGLTLTGGLEAINAQLSVLVFTPDPDHQGESEIKLTVQQADLETTFLLPISVLPVNDPPSVQTLEIPDLDEDAGTVSYTGWVVSLAPGPENESEQEVTVSEFSFDHPELFSEAPALSEDGTLSFTLAPNAFGTFVLTLTVTDDGGTENGGLDTATHEVIVTINPIDDLPEFSPTDILLLAEDTSVSFGPDTPYPISLSDVDQGAVPLTVHLTSYGLMSLSEEHPEVTLTWNGPIQLTLTGGLDAINAQLGALVFTPYPNYYGSAGIGLTVDQDGTETPFLLPIYVLPVNDLPSVQIAEIDSPVEDSGPIVVPDWVYDLSPGPENESEQQVTMVLEVDRPELFSKTPALSESGELSFQLAPDAVGTFTLTLTVSDDGGTENDGVDTVTREVAVTIIPVNDPPSFTAGASLTVDEDSGASVVAAWAAQILAGPPDEEGQSLNFQVSVDRGSLFTEAPSISPAGTLSFTPAPNANGRATVTVALSDDGDGTNTSSAETFFITISPVNDAPQLTVPGSQSVLENDRLVLQGLSIQDLDAEGGALRVSLSSTVAITLASVSGISFVAGEQGATSMTFDGTLSDVNAAIDRLTLTPAYQQRGAFDLEISVDDQGNTGGTPLGASGSVAVSIIPVNRLPLAQTDSGSGFAGESVPLPVLANDTDGDGDVLSISGVTSPVGGVVAIQPDGTLVYTPHADFEGTDTFTYTVSDGQGGESTTTVTVRVSAPGPDLDGISSSVEDGVNDEGDGNGDGIRDREQSHVSSFPVLTGPNEGRFLTLVSRGGEQLARVTSEELPALDTAPADTEFPLGRIGFTADGLPEGHAMVVEIILPRGVEVVSYYKYGPTAANPESHWYEFLFDGTTGAIIRPETATRPSVIDLYLVDGLRGDGDLLANGRIVDPGIPVFRKNALPIIGEDWATLDEDTAILLYPVDNDVDPEGMALSLDAVGLAGHGIVEVGPRGAVLYTPNADFFGTDRFTYTVSDGSGLPVMAEVVVVVNPIQDAPVALDDAGEVDEDGELVIEIFANDYDPDGDHFFITSLDKPSHGTAVYDAGRFITYKPHPDFAGVDSFHYSIADAAGGSSRAKVVVTVLGANDAPRGLADEVQVLEDHVIGIAVLDNDTDPDGDALTIIAFTQPGHGTVSLGEDGSLVYTPSPEYSGADAFTYTVSDGTAETGPITVTITVEAVNDAPHFPDTEVIAFPAPVFEVSTEVWEASYTPATDVDDVVLVHEWQVARTEAFEEIIFSGTLDGVQIALSPEELLALLTPIGLVEGGSVTIWLRMAATDPSGATGFSNPQSVTFTLGATTGVGTEELPAEFYLAANYPNPFNPSTTLVFGLKEPANVRVVLYDAMGRQVRVLVDEHRNAGHFQERVNLSDLPTGVYVYRLTAGSFTHTRMMHLVR